MAERWGRRTEWELAGERVEEEIYDKDAARGIFEGVSETDPCLNHGSDMTPSVCQKSEWPNTGKNFTVCKFKKEHDIKNSYQHSFPVCSAAKPCLCDPVDCSPPGSSVHGISQARVLEQVAISFSRGSSPPRD